MKQKLAIIGTGIAGMTAGHLLHKLYDITLYEKETYIGGHTNTVEVDENGVKIPVDTGFMVYNHHTYPNLVSLFRELGVREMDTSMSFSVHHGPSGLEFSGTGLNGLFAQRRNLVNPRYIRMLLQINRFNEESLEILEDPRYDNHTLAQYAFEKQYGNDMLERYLLPMSSAVWSTEPDRMLDFPARTLVRFFHNHGFLGLNTQHQWKTLVGGSNSYKRRLIEPFKEKIHTARAARQIRREGGRAAVVDQTGTVQTYDHVILACHADQALAMLEKPTDNEHRLLSAFSYQKNTATLHTDAAVMPRNKRVWSSWNYRVDRMPDGAMEASTIYWMNSLQRVSQKRNYFVSINGEGNVRDESILFQTDYDHPVFSVRANNAQKELPRLNDRGPVYFCGSYFKYGFHEDALTSALSVAERLLD